MLLGTFAPDGAVLLRIFPSHPQYEAIAREVARTKAAQAGPVQLSGAKSGRWITIGGHKGEDGTRCGGSPV